MIERSMVSERLFKILFGGFVVWVFSALTISSNVPSLHSPFSITVALPTLFSWGLVANTVFPMLFGVLIGSFPIVLFYFAWTYFFVRAPYKISRAAVFLALVLIALSAYFNVRAYPYGIEYQGELHTWAMCLYNFLGVSALAYVFCASRRAPSFRLALIFNIILFSWLGWASFPWLGELI